MPSAGEFCGLWTRSLIVFPDGRRDAATVVTWLQSVTLFADLRQPPGLAGRPFAACRDALTAQDCLALAQQQGFSGRFEPREAGFEWVRCIDYQPPQPLPDIGRLFWQDGILVEQGLATEYTEHWHRESAPISVSGFWLSDPARGVSGCLLRVDNRFAYVRGRAEAIAGETLAALVSGAATLQRMQALVDCEISFGDLQSWRITRSSLPYRSGTRLGAHMRGDRLAVPDEDAAGNPIERLWDITRHDGDLSVIFETPNTDRGQPR
jgi:allophanate hydrolase